MNAAATATKSSASSSIARPLSYAFCKCHGVLLETHDDRQPTIHCRDNTDLKVLLELQRYSGSPEGIETHTDTDFEQLLSNYFEAERSSSTVIADDLNERYDLATLAQQMPPPEDLLDENTNAPIISLINALLAEAIRQAGSDIHLEPYADRLIIRFRVDGVLREVLKLEAGLAPIMASRIKVMARLDIAEKRLPQDGRLSVQSGQHQVDLRVSTLPSAYGERVVMRILDQQAALIGLDQLGFSTQQMAELDQLASKPHGVLLVTGPTGSGKTTTLYAMLNRLNDQSRNIMTVEDPIEYHLEGIGQTQVNPKVDLDFARGLRAILRQDPDVVMVGEIRDLETAQIATQASLTGHLVFSTLHTNSAVGAIARLRDMGIESFQLAAGLTGLLAQRLVRKLCPACKQPTQPDNTLLTELKLPTGTELYEAIGCDQCGNSGYKGRIGLFELISINEDFRQLIHDGSGEAELELAARQYSESLSDSGRQRLLNGDTTVAELTRVSEV
ncbi:MAG: Flp pilus assembly complex ATPase component TadA [Immundisolibacteraceae bacterium]|nr:Flp pilus assembly complex ATPase component TadA [Immundisolibacteraceae bacterium]